VFDGVGDLPFFLHVPPQGKTGRAYVINGDETADFQAEWRDNEITITGPWTYTSVIEAQRRPATGALEGTWTRDTPLWGAVVRNFLATPIAAPDPKTRFPGDAAAAAAPPVHVAGTWQFQFEQHQEGKGAFEQTADGVVHGYVKPGQLGDIRFLAGNLHGGKLALSQFNGNAANLVLADVAPDGMSMSGVMSMQNVWNEKFTAKKVADYHFVNKVHLKDGKQTITLKGLDTYRGKPTLAILFATWCSSCNDAYPVFKQLYATYHPQGLEVLGVAYDLSEDVKANQAQLDAFRARHQVPWELIQVPCTPETWAKAMPPELEGWDGLPIVLLVRPDGTVQTVFGGWFGPATGAEGVELRKSFEAQIQEMVESARRPG
jgi:thiol-disulfide isomerase/thioredoxin